MPHKFQRSGGQMGRLSRRRFLMCPSAALVASVLGGNGRGLQAARLGESQEKPQASSGPPAAPSPLPWIDAHAHVWSDDLARWPLAPGKTAADLQPMRFLPETLLALGQSEGVGRVVLIQHSIYHLWDNSYLLDCARRFPGRFAVLGMLDDRQAGAGERLRALQAQGLCGLRITPRIYGLGWLDGEGMAGVWETAAQTGQVLGCLIDPEHLPQVDAMCRRFPQTRVVIDHMARIGADGMIRPEQVAALCRLAQHRHVAVKLSAFYALGRKQPPYDDLLPLVRRVLDAFGPSRCMWASDAPYQVQPPHSYTASISLIRDRLEGLSAGDRQWLLARTAESYFFS